jgi:predicted enzyme related to lactoylglutathione lyase
MATFRVCIDVDELDKAIAFYTQAFDLHVGRRIGRAWAELLGAQAPIDLLAKKSGTLASPAAAAVRDYARHWTPVHLDFEVTDVDAAVARARSAGATLERDIETLVWGRMANMADPFGHGFCLLEFRGRGYDEMLSHDRRP